MTEEDPVEGAEVVSILEDVERTAEIEEEA